MATNLERRIKAMESAPTFTDVEQLSLLDLLESTAQAIGATDPAAAQTLRACPQREALACAAQLIANHINEVPHGNA